MSAFVIDPSTMHRVIRGICRAGVCQNFAGFSTEPAQNYDRIGRALFALNIEAVNQRYPDTRACADNLPGMVGCEAFPETYTYDNDFRTLLSLGAKTDAYKAITCLIYQCSEGNVPETALYRELEAVAGSLAANIVAHLPEYEAASW